MGGWRVMVGADLKVGKELATHDAFQQHVKVGGVFEAGNQVDHEGAAAPRLNLLLTLHMSLHAARTSSQDALRKAQHCWGNSV